MIMKTYKYLFLFSFIAAVFLSGCESLDVKNENDPDFKTAFSNPSDVKGVASSLINTWYQKTFSGDGGSGNTPAFAFWVGADAGTCSWGNWAMWDFSHEPRITWDNTPSYSNSAISNDYFNGLYSGLSSANEVLQKVELEGMKITNDDGSDAAPMVAAIAHLAQALNLGYIGLVYDKAFVVTEYTDLTQAVPVSPYMDLIDTALVSLDKCIALCNANTFTLPSTWIPSNTVTYTQKEIGELANTVAGLLMSYSPRNKTQNDAVDWNKVLSYANNGLTYDFAPLMNDITWYNLYATYANYSGWGQTDMRLVNMMDPRFPAHWPGANGFDPGVLPTPITSHTDGVDDRIFTDFGPLTSCPFKVERGYYEFSNYRSTRFDKYLTTWTEQLAVFYKAENDLLKAEALLHTSNVAGAAAIINAGTRVTRGHLAPIGATALEVENAIFYERNIELYCSDMGVEFYTMRKADQLQAGTPLHLPIPGAQLAVNLMDYYTFGGNVGVAGEDYSSGGWFK
jgi:hypothetical protein